MKVTHWWTDEAARVQAILDARGWYLKVGEQTAEDKRQRRTPPMVLYIRAPQGYDPYNHVGWLA